MARGGPSSFNGKVDSHYLFSTGDIKYDMLSQIENKLTDYEKVSLIFLLYDDANVAIERLELLVGQYENDSYRTNLLEDWAKGREQYWRETLLEGLLIIKAYKDVKDLKFNLQHVKDHFLPEQLLTSIFIHPARKALFGMCEEFLIKDTENFISYVINNSKISIKRHKNHCNYLELFLLHMIKNEVITVGTWSPRGTMRTRTEVKSDLDIICNFLKTNNFFQFHDILNNVKDFINSNLQFNYDNKTDAKNASKSITRINETSSLSKEDDTYKIYDSASLGWFLIFNQKSFVKNEDNLAYRSGTEKDGMELKKCWSSYGFTTILFNDLNSDDILSTIKTYAKFVKPLDSAFGVCILSHGNSSGVFGSDSVLLEMSLIKNSLYTDNLLGKPKILLVQACRGENKMKVSIQKETIITNNVDKYLQSDGPSVIPEKADLVVFCATVDDFVSYRHKIDGSWFIQIVCECLMKYGNEKHLLDIFTKVTEKIADKGLQISEHTSTFRKFFYLKRL